MTSASIRDAPQPLANKRNFKGGQPTSFQYLPLIVEKKQPVKKDSKPSNTKPPHDTCPNSQPKLRKNHLPIFSAPENSTTTPLKRKCDIINAMDNNT
jgi:hypothetical protein